MPAESRSVEKIAGESFLLKDVLAGVYPAGMFLKLRNENAVAYARRPTRHSPPPHAAENVRTEYIRAKMADVPERWLKHMPETADVAELEQCERLIRGEMASHAKRQRGHAADRMRRAWEGG